MHYVEWLLALKAAEEILLFVPKNLNFFLILHHVDPQCFAMVQSLLNKVCMLGPRDLCCSFLLCGPCHLWREFVDFPLVAIYTRPKFSGPAGNGDCLQRTNISQIQRCELSCLIISCLVTVLYAAPSPMMTDSWGRWGKISKVSFGRFDLKSLEKLPHVTPCSTLFPEALLLLNTPGRLRISKSRSFNLLRIQVRSKMRK